MITHQYNLNKGTLLDNFGNTTINSNGVFEGREKGLAWIGNGSNAKLELGDIGNVKSLAFWINLQTISEEIFEGDPNAHLILASAGTLSYPDFDNAFVDGVDTNTITTGWHLLIITSTTDVECGDAVLALNNAAYGELWCSKIIIYDHELTSKERAKLMSDFNNASNISRSVPVPLAYPKADDLSSVPNISAAFNYTEPGNNTDISGNGFNDTSTGGFVQTKDGRLYKGVGGKSVIGNLGNIKSIAFRIKLDSATEKIMEGAANDKLIHVASGTLTYPEFDNAFIDGIDTNTMVADQWHNVVIISSTDVDFSACTLALNNTTYGKFEIEGLRFFSDEKDLQWAKDYNNSFAQRVVRKGIVEDFGVETDQFGMSGKIIFDSGTFSVQELFAQDGDVPQLDIFTKYMQCDSNGVFRVPYTESTDVDAVIDYFDGANWSRKEDTLANLITNNAWLSQSGGYLVFTLTSGTAITTYLIFGGVEQ